MEAQGGGSGGLGGIGKAAGVIGLVVAAAKTLKVGAEASVWFNDLSDAMNLVTGSAEAGAAAMAELNSVSSEYSLSDAQYEMAVKMSVALQSQGMEAHQAAIFVRELANAAEAMGGSIGDMEAMMAAIDKMNAKDGAGIKQLDALTSKMPGMRKILEEGLGTANAAELERAEFTPEQIRAGILRGMQAQENAHPDMMEQGLQETNFDRSKQKALLLEGKRNSVDLEKRAPVAGGGRELLDQRIKDNAARDAEAERRKAEDDRDGRLRGINATLDEAVKRDNEARSIQDAILQGDDARVEKLETARDIRAETTALEEDGLKLDEAHLAVIRAMVGARRADAAAIKMGEAVKAAKEGDDAAKIGQLRHMGRNARANRIEDKAKKEQLVKDGLPERDAENIVERDRNTEEDERLGPGRRRLRMKKDPHEYGSPAPRSSGGIVVPAQATQQERAAERARKDAAAKIKPSASDSSGQGATASKAIVDKLTEIANNTRAKPNEAQQPATKK